MARPYVQHNVFLALLTETGAVGLGLWLMTIGLWARNGWRLWASKRAPIWARQHGLLLLALIVAYTVNGMFHDVGIITMANMLLFFAAGVSQGLLPHTKNAPASRPQRATESQALAAQPSGA